MEAEIRVRVRKKKVDSMRDCLIEIGRYRKMKEVQFEDEE